MTEEVIDKAPRTAPLDRCPLCESSETKFFFSSRDQLHGVPGEFSYHICSNCRTVYQNPMVIQEDLHLCYPEEYSPYRVMNETAKPDPYAEPTGSFKSVLRKAIVDEVRGSPAIGFRGILGRVFAKSARMRERAFFSLVTDECLPRGKDEHFALDLGCGSGWLLENLATVGWKADGVEWNGAAAAHAKDVTDGDVWTGDFREVDIPKGKYGLIVLNHVFEHINDPRGALRRIYELLADGGKVVLNYPNPHSLGAKWNNNNWFPWEVPRHLIFPTPKAVKLLARSIEFSAVDVKTRAYYSEVHWNWSKAYKLGRHPEKDPPGLNIVEKAGVISEKIVTKLGLNIGWEIVAILTK